MSGRFQVQEGFKASASFDLDVSAQLGLDVFGRVDDRQHRPHVPQPCERPPQPCLPQVEICHPQPQCPPPPQEHCRPAQPAYRTPGCWPTPGQNNGYNPYNPVPNPNQGYNPGFNPGFNPNCNNEFRPPVQQGQASWGSDNGFTANGGGIGWTTDAYGRSQGQGGMQWRNADGSMGQATIRSGNGAGVIDWATNTGQRGEYQWGPGYYTSYTTSVQQNPYIYRPQY